MTLRGIGIWSALLLFLLPSKPRADEPSGTTPSRPAWELDATLSFYVVPGQVNFLQPAVTADQGPVHLEARYNYEALRTASFLVGWNFDFSHTITFTLTPLLGCMAGDAGGPIVGLEFLIAWGPLSFSSQGEWVFDLVGGSEPYAYVWAELDVSPWDWLRVGVALQRTKVFEVPEAVVVGPLVGFAVWKLAFSAYWFQPGGTSQSFVFSAGLSF